MTFGLAPRARSVGSPSLFQSRGRHPGPLDIRQIGHRNSQLVSQVKQNLQAGIPLTTLNLLKVPEGDRRNVLLGSTGNMPRTPDVFANQLSKRGKVHAPSF